MKMLPVAILLKVAGNVLPSQAFRAWPHSIKNLTGDCFLNTQTLHSDHKLVMQVPGPLNLQHQIDAPAEQHITRVVTPAGMVAACWVHAKMAIYVHELLYCKPLTAQCYKSMPV